MADHLRSKEKLEKIESSPRCEEPEYKSDSTKTEEDL